MDYVIEKYGNGENVNLFLEEASECYSDSQYIKPRLSYEEVIKKTSTKMTEWLCHRVDLAYAINKPVYPNGETELMISLRWNRSLDVIVPWFLMLVRFGGNPYQKNKKGEDAYDIAKQLFIDNEEFLAFYEEVEKCRKET